LERLIADSLLDFGDEKQGWRFGATLLKEPFSVEIEASELLPAPWPRERISPGACRVAGALDKTGYFWVGRDVWQPGHDIGLRLSWRADSTERLQLAIDLAPINSWCAGRATFAIFHNCNVLMQGSCEECGFINCCRTISVNALDVIDVIFGYEGTIDNLECFYRAKLVKDNKARSFGDEFFDPRKANDLTTLVQRLDAVAASDIDILGVQLGQAGYFSARARK